MSKRAFLFCFVFCASFRVEMEAFGVLVLGVGSKGKGRGVEGWGGGCAHLLLALVI